MKEILLNISPCLRKQSNLLQIKDKVAKIVRDLCSTGWRSCTHVGYFSITWMLWYLTDTS